MNPPTTIEANRLAGWGVLPGGAAVGLELTDTGSGTHRLVLPFDLLSTLLMTLPRMLQRMLDMRRDATLRLVQPLGGWRIEQPAGHDGMILELATPDGFEISFAATDEIAGALGAALLAAPDARTLTLTRKPH